MFQIRENPMIVRKISTGKPVAVNIVLIFRIPGIPHSAVEQVETNRKEKVRRLIEQFENHPNKNVLLKDYKKSEEINHFSRESKDLITEMGNDEIFECYETSSKRQCSDFALYWEIGIENCTCGINLQPTAMNRHYNKDRFDTLSIPGYVIKKNQSGGPRHGQSMRQIMRQIMYYKARDMLRKAKLPKDGSCETILERWQTDATYQKSLSAERWTEEKIKEYDARQRNWEIVLNTGGVQAPIRQRPDFREAKRACCRPYEEHVESYGQGNQSIHPAQQEDKILNDNLKVTRSTPTRFTLELDGDIILQQVRLHPRSGSRTMNGSRIKVGIVDLQPGLNSKICKVEISTGKLVAPLQTRSDSDTIFLLFR